MIEKQVQFREVKEFQQFCDEDGTPFTKLPYRYQGARYGYYNANCAPQYDTDLGYRYFDPGRLVIVEMEV